jgi:hypothetical protein
MENAQRSFENPFSGLSYEPTTAGIIFTYKRFGTSEEFRSAWTMAAELAYAKRVYKWVFHSLRMEMLRPADQDWFIEVMVPRMNEVAQQPLQVAVVIPESVFAKLSVMNIAKAVKENQDAVFQFFATEEQALAWLKTV